MTHPARTDLRVCPVAPRWCLPRPARSLSLVRLSPLTAARRSERGHPVTACPVSRTNASVRQDQSDHWSLLAGVAVPEGSRRFGSTGETDRPNA
jgi:hypothetical protein